MRAVPVFVSLLLVLTVALAQARTPPHVTKYFADARLAGIGKYTWYGFHVYDARLYVPTTGIDRGNPAASAFALELTYKRSLSGRAIADASRDEIERMGFGTDQLRARWHAQMVELFPDVEPDHTLAGVNLPGRGVRFYLDGKALGSIDDPQFAHAFFAIWLDERTSAPRLRESLLRQAAAAG
jgi:hypothetical protein